LTIGTLAVNSSIVNYRNTTIVASSEVAFLHNTRSHTIQSNIKQYKTIIIMKTNLKR